MARRYRLLLGTLLLLLAGYPYLERSEVGAIGLEVLASGAVLAALFAVGLRTRHRALAAGLAGVVILLDWAPGLPPGAALAGHGLEMLFYGLATAALAREVFGRARVDADTLAGAVCVYLLFGVAWTSAYALLVALEPEAFGASGPEGWTELLFFSFTTLTTTGYGDISPQTAPARSLAMLEYVTGVLYLTILVARLVSMYQAEPRETKEPVAGFPEESGVPG